MREDWRLSFYHVLNYRFECCRRFFLFFPGHLYIFEDGNDRRRCDAARVNPSLQNLRQSRDFLQFFGFYFRNAGACRSSEDMYKDVGAVLCSHCSE